MALPPYAFSDLPVKLAVEMSDADVIGLDDLSAGVTKGQEYSVLKSFFLKTNEARTITAGGVTVNDTFAISFGTDGDLKIHHTAGVSYIENTVNSGEIFIQAKNSASATIDMLELDPDGPTIAIGACNVAGSNNATHGFGFDGSGNTQIKKILQCTGKIECGNNIDLGANYISGDGTNVGLSMVAGAATFSSTVDVTGKLTCDTTSQFDGAMDINANVAAGSNNISYSGASSTGLEFTAANAATFNQALRGLGNIRCNSFTVDNGVTSSGMAGQTIGLNMSVYTGNLTFTAGILTAYT